MSSSIRTDSLQLRMESVDLHIKQGKHNRAIEILMISKDEFPESMELWVRLADLVFEREDYEQARKILNQAIDHNPKSVELWVRLADLEIKQKRFSQVRRIFKKAIDHIPDSVKLWVRRVRSSDLILERKRFIQVREILKQAIDHIPYSVELWVKLANLEIEQDNNIQAREILKQALIHIPNSVELWVKLADLTLEQKHFNQARGILKQALVHVPNSLDLWVKLADLTLEQKHFKQTRGLLKTAIDYIPDSVELWVKLANLEIEQGNHIQVREILKQAIDSFPNSVELWIKLAWIEYQTDNEENGQYHETLENALISFADYEFEIKPVEWIMAARETAKAFTFYSTGRLISRSRYSFFETTVKSIIPLFSDKNEIDLCREISTVFEQIFLIFLVRRFPTTKRFWVQAIFYENLFNKEDQKELLIIACRHCPNDTSLRNLIQGVIHLTKNYKSLAGRFFNKVNDVYYKQQLLTIEKYRDVIDHMSEVQKEMKALEQIDISDEDVGKGKSLKFKIEGFTLKHILEDVWLAGDHEVVWKSLEKAISNFNEDGGLWDMKAQIEIKKGELDQAAESYRKVINICREYSIDFVIRLSELEQDRGNLLEARNILKSAKAKFPDNVQLWIAIIRLELQINEKSNAQSLLTQAMDKFPTSGIIWAQAISMEERCKRGAKVVDAMKICGDDKHDDEDAETKYVMLAAAKFFFSKGDVKKSRKWFNKTIKRHPKFADAWIYFYKLEKLWGTEKSARDTLFRFIIFEKNLHSYDREWHESKEWIKFKDHIDNWGLIDEELLELIVKKDNISVEQI